MLQAHGVGVSHNPESNMKLASGTAPVPGYLKAGVKLGLGTDGAASNNDLDMFEAMRQAAFLHKLTTGRPAGRSARDGLEMATIGGARALGLAERLGSLEPGKCADLIVVRHGPGQADADVRSGVASRLRDAWRRCASRPRARPGADAGRHRC